MPTGEHRHYFLETIRHLRTSEAVLLHSGIHPIEVVEADEVAAFLHTAYTTESLEYPHHAPDFDNTAAVWAAKIVYTTAQLLLYRSHEAEELPELLPAYEGNITASAILSADLCLRFLPELLMHAEKIDREDALIPLLEAHLTVWHYSGIGRKTDLQPDLEIIFSSACLQQSYINRIIETKNKTLASMPVLQTKIKAAMGNHAHIFWNTDF